MSVSPSLIGILSALLFLSILYVFRSRGNTASPYVRYSSLKEQDGIMKYLALAATSVAPAIPEPLLRRKPSSKAKLEAKLNKAGNPWKVTPMEFVILRYTLAVLGIFLGLFVFWGVGPTVGFLPWWSYVLFCSILGFVLPDLQYKMSTDNRDIIFKKKFPDALDMLVISTSSGSAFKQAMSEVVPLLPDSIVKNELAKVNDDIAAGNTITGALDNLAKRSPNADMEAFVKAIKQAEEYGSNADITKTLRARADTNREEYDSFVETKIAKLSSHMMAILAPTLIGALGVLCLAPMLSLISAYGLF